MSPSTIYHLPSTNIPFVFFGTSPVAVGVLYALEAEGYLPALIVTTPDAPAGRKLTLTSPPAKLWAREHNIPLLQPAKLNPAFVQELTTSYFLLPTAPELFLVASYGLLIPRRVLDLPKHGTLNVHPSLLPKYRGPSPIQSAILNGDTETGVTIMLMNEKMDEGPMLIEERVSLTGNEVNEELEIQLATIGGKVLAHIIPDWIAGKINPREQDHTQATYTRKFEKSDGYIEPSLLECHSREGGNLGPSSNLDPRCLGDDTIQEAERKVRALGNTPGTYTILQTKGGKEMRVKILSAKIEDEKLVPLRVIPEGKKEMSWEEFKRGSL